MKKRHLLIPAIAGSLILCAAGLTACSGGDEQSGEVISNEAVLTVDDNVTGISLDTTNATLVYDVGGKPFDISGVALMLHYADGDKCSLIADSWITAPDLSTNGAKTVTVTYGAYTASYAVYVRRLDAIELNTDGAKKKYELGSDFDATGLTVSARYADIEDWAKSDFGISNTEVISSTDYTVTADLSSRGTKTVTVSYLNRTAGFDVKVVSTPTLLSSAVTADAGGVYITLDGSTHPDAEYAVADISMDIQPLSSDTRYPLTVSECTIDANGAFNIRGALPADIGSANGYLVHVFMDGEQYDVVSLESAADSTVEYNSAFYRLKSEKAFDNNESMFAVLRRAADINAVASYTLTKAEIKEISDSPHLVIHATHGYSDELLQKLRFHFDAESNPRGMGLGDISSEYHKYLESDAVTATADGAGAFTVSIDISTLSPYAYTLHFYPYAGTPATGDAQNLTMKGTDKQYEVCGKGFKLVYGSDLYWKAVGLVVMPGDPTLVTDIEIDTSSVKTTYRVGEAFTDSGLKVYKVMGDGSRIELQKAADGYSLSGPSASDMNEAGQKDVTVTFDGFTKTYKISVVSEPTLSGATLREESGRLIMEIAGTVSGSTAPVITMDIQEYGTNDKISAACTPVVDPSTYDFTATLDLSAIELGDKMYMFHVNINGVSYDLKDLATPADATLQFGAKYYRLLSECCFKNNMSKFVILRRGDSEAAITPTVFHMHTVTLVESGGKAYIRLVGYYDGISSFDGLSMSLTNLLDWSTASLGASTVTAADHAFEVLTEVTGSGMTSGKQYALKLVFAYGSVNWNEYIYNVPDSSDKTLPGGVIDATVSAGGATYTIEEMQNPYDSKKLVGITLS